MTLVLATQNAGKVQEFQALLADCAMPITPLAHWHNNEPAETGTDFIANARIKAQAAVAVVGEWCLSDDSGLCVPALGGAPGVATADWAGVPRDWDAAMAKLYAAIMPYGDWRAYFIAVLCLLSPDGREYIFAGRVDGTLIWPPRGARGFGFDPMFVPDGYDQSFAEMPPDLKNRLSHRARACEKLRQWLMTGDAA